MSDVNCAICDKTLGHGEQTVVKERGLLSFIEASKKRNDGKVVLFKSVDRIEVHEKCRKQYINEKIIAAQVKRTKERMTYHVRSSSSFSFRSHCFLCGVEIPPDYGMKQVKKTPSQRNLVYPVRMLAVRDTVLRLARSRNDDYGHSIVCRVEPVNDLVAADAQYHVLCMKNLHLPPRETQVQGRPKDDQVDAAMQSIYYFLENSDEECQFTLEELINQVAGNFRPHESTVKKRLLEKYGEDILITASKPYVVCFKATGYKVVNNNWFRVVQQLSLNEERLKVVEAAATIIVEDIRSQVYDLDHYPPSATFLEGHEKLIPETLRSFTDKVVLSKKRGNTEKWQNISFGIAHTIIQAVRPKSFLSPLLVGLGTFLYKKFGSRRLIDVLSSLGFCASYTEVTRLEVSSLNLPPLAVKEQAFCQIVCDNADSNIHTIDGHDTFHSMGCIGCITPKSAVVPGQCIVRLKDAPRAQVVGSIAAVELKTFEKSNDIGLAAIVIQDLSKIFPDTNAGVPSVPTLLWLYGKCKDLPGVGGWNGFMTEVSRDIPYQTTFIECMPFIHSHPSDIDTIYTALLFAVEKTRSLGQETTIVTFDQPLYLKAREIVASRLEDPQLHNVIIRLGGFHLIMSFMGAIGHIMEGSGLSELLNTVFAVNSTEKLLTGHAYARAVRAHLLTFIALSKIIFDSIDFSPSFHYDVEHLLYGADRSEVLTAYEQDFVKELVEKFKARIHQLASLGPTAQLWTQYFEMITLLLNFIHSERIGNWALHLQTIYDMLPYFYASGHYLYAKCSLLYLQDMLQLEQIMPPAEFSAFTEHGAFTIRRTDKCWSGTWSDMTIEQTLMKQMKVEGGLTRARGFSEGILARWTLGMSTLQHVSDAIEEFCGVNLSSSEQHIDWRSTRIKRDNSDVKKMLEWLNQHPPFPNIPELISISTGIVGNENINCHQAREVGINGIRKIIGGNFKTLKYKRSDRVLSLASMTSAIVVDDQRVTINPDTLFKRMCIAKQSEEDLEEFLTYELCPFPLSLFDVSGMRKGTKSSLYKTFKQLADTTIIDNNTCYVVDGGFLLHKVVWTKGQPFTKIIDSYSNYIRCQYGSKQVVVFDGYPDDQKGTKAVERRKRLQRKHAVDLQFTTNMVPTVSQEIFLSSQRNKSQLISVMKTKLNEAGIQTEQAPEDADTLIARTAISLAPNHSTVVVVGEDVDLLVILVGLQAPLNVYFLKPGRGKVAPALYHPSTCVEKSVADNILFLHAVSGCDTTSSLYNLGKIKHFKTIKKHPELIEDIRRFTNPSEHQALLFEAGKKFLVALYGGNHNTTSLNRLRYKLYLSTAYKDSGHMASIPPTEEAAHEHILRTYHQVQQWLGNHLDPLKWGWKTSSNGLIPVTNKKALAPEKLLKNISCRCAKECRGNCGCRRAGLFCSKLCSNCEGKCLNIDMSYEPGDQDDPDDLMIPPETANVTEVEVPPPIQEEDELGHSISSPIPGPSTASLAVEEPGPSRPKRKRP